MTFVLDALRDKPQGIFQMDDTSPLQDYSGYNRTGVINGALTKHISLAKGASYAPLLTNAITAEFSSNVFKQGAEQEPFTLSAWFRIVSGTGEQQVLGNSGQMDGLTVNGNVVSFVTKYTTAPESRCSYTLQHEQAVAAWGVHTESKNSLYVNGVLVDEVSLTEDQKTDTYAASSANLFSGLTAGTQTLAVGPVAFYSHALSGSSIDRQYRTGRSVLPLETIVTSFGGNTVPLSLSNFETFLNQTWDSEENWGQGSLSNVAVVNDELVPQFDGDTSVAGYWYDSIAIDSADASTIYGVVLDWIGDGAVVETSTTGTSWSTATKGQMVSGITEGTYDPTDKVLQVRVSFPGGIVDDESYLSLLKATGILSGTSLTRSSGRTATISIATPRDNQPHLDLHDNWGTGLSVGGQLVLSDDPKEITTVRTLELWIKRIGDQPVISAAGTYYQNGVVASSTLPASQWVLMHITSPTDITGAITIDGPAQVGHIAVYDYTMTATDVASVYAAYAGTNSQRVTDSSGIGITESAPAADIYAYDWAITGAG